jgi:hypothetical protein
LALNSFDEAFYFLHNNLLEYGFLGEAIDNLIADMEELFEDNDEEK